MDVLIKHGGVQGPTFTTCLITHPVVRRQAILVW